MSGAPAGLPELVLKGRPVQTIKVGAVLRLLGAVPSMRGGW